MAYKITLIGSGNMAYNLAYVCDQAGHTINQIVSKNEETAKELASKYGAYYGTQLSELYNDSDFIIICVNDESIANVLTNLPDGIKGIVCHTSGAISMDVLSNFPGNYGVLYPLQSLTKTRVQSFMNVPVFVEWSHGEAKTGLLSLAESISNKVSEVTSENRMKYHLAAVFANNFTNLMYCISADYLAENKLDFKNLLPIIEETANRLKFGSPNELQTGPAKRGDQKIIETHLTMLPTKQLQEIYIKLSEFIMTK